MKRYISKTILLILFLFPTLLIAQNENLQDTTPLLKHKKFDVEIGGLVRLNGIYDFQGLQNISDFTTYQIPVPTGNKDNRLAFSARQSRIFFKPTYHSPIGEIDGYIEADFYSDNNESSAYFRLRFAFLQWKGFTVGQAFTTFFIEETEPILVDFESPPSFSVRRVPLIRWEGNITDKVSLGLAVENPVFDYTPIMNEAKPYAHMPDFVARLRFEEDDFFIQPAFLLREIRYDVPGDIRKSTYGWGVSVGGVINVFENDQINYYAAGGRGISSYFSDLFGNNLDAFPKSMTELDLLGSVGWFAAYKHQWNPKSFSYGTFAMLNLDNSSEQADDAFKSSTYIALNYFYEPVTVLRLGLEGLYGQRINKNNQSGNAYRINFLIQISF